MLNPKLIGGSRDGEEISEESKVSKTWPSVIYKTARISTEEAKELNIDDITCWKHPEDVYYFNGTNYIFDRRVNYKP